MADPNILNPYERIWKTRDLSALETPIELENNTSQFRRGLNAFGKEMQATGYGLAALGAQGLENVIGENAVTSGITDWGIEGYKEAIDESQSGYNAPNVADVSNIKGVGDFTDWASYQLGKGLPMLGSLVLSGGVGGAVARLTAKEGIKQIAKGAVGSAVKKGVETKALQAAEGQLITKTMQEAAAKALRDRVVAGTMAGGFTGSFGLEGGLAFGEQVEAGVKSEDAVKSAIAVGGINGALEFLPFYGVAKSIGMGQYAKKSIKEIIKNDAGLSKKAIALATAKELGGRALKGGLVGAGAEGITEGLQELTSIAGLRWAKQDPLFAGLSDDDWNRIGNAMAAGALVGGVAAGAGSTLGGPEVTDNTSTDTNAPPAGTTAPPAVKTREQEIEAGLAKITTNLEAAKTAGDTKAIQELQQIKELYDAALGKQKPPLETPPNEQIQPITQDQPIPGTTETQAQPPLEIPAGPEGTGGVREEGTGTETRPVEEVVQPTPGERIQLKRGEEIVLTPNGTPVRTTPTPEEVEALRQRMGPRPEKQPIGEAANAQEVQAQAEAPVVKVSPLVEEMFQAGTQSVDELRSRINNVRSGPIISGKETIEFTLDGKSYTGFMEGRNRDLVVSNDNSDTDKAVAARVLLDGKAEVKSGAVPLQSRALQKPVTDLFAETPQVTEATMEEFEAVRRQFQERQSQTPFKKWFGTGTPNITATKEGEPITLYHGTNNPAFFEWDSTKAGEASGHPTSGLGFFMTANPGAAARYGNNLLELHAKINNPYTLTDADLTSIETQQDAVQLRKRLMSKGYDGAVVTAPGASPYVIAFQANQIKLKSNTAPTDSPDMRYSKPLQTVTPEMDAEYLAAVERGDIETAQRMVDEVAKKAGYTIDAWHGTTKKGLKRIRPDKAVETESTIFLAENEDVADTFTIPREYGEPVYEDENGEEISPGENIKAKLMLQNPLILKEDTAQKFVDDTAFQGRTVKQAIADGYGGIIAQNVLEGIGEQYRGDNYVVFKEGLIKRADPVTYDNAKNVIPLSQRFNATTPDIRYTQQPGTTTTPLQDFQSNIDSIMGEGWLQQATEAGLVEVVDGKGPNGESGSWAGDRIRLYTGSMPKDGSPAGVLLHEGKHVTFEDVLGNSLPEYVKDLHTLADNGNKVAQDAITHAAIAVADVLGIKHNLLEDGTKADLKNLRALIEQERPGLLAEEELAYFVQYGTDAQTGTGFWKRLINQIKAWFAQTRLGQRMKELGIGFEMTDTMAVEWAKMGLNRSLEKLQQAEKARTQAEKQASTMPASARLGKTLAALEEVDPLYTFAGKQALTANLTLQLEAEQRIKLGESAESVRQDTGWFLNEADGKWRFEISDKDMQLKIPFDSIPESKLFKEQPVNLEDVIVHDKLFAAYPFLKNISLIKQEAFLDLGDTQGWFNPDKMQISITPTATNPLSTILHEIQHVVQMYEGFARGGNESSAWAALPNETKEDIIKGVVNKLEERNQREQEKLEILNQIAGLDNDYIRQYRQYRKAEREIGFSQEQELFEKEFFKFFGVTSARDFNYTKRRVFRSIVEEGDNLDVYRNKVNKELLRNMDDITKVKAGDERAIKIHANLYEFYKRLAAETEARLTQARQQMTEEERQSISPESMMDYPYGQQIVAMQGGNSAELSVVKNKYANTPQWMKAPNGKPTKLNERQWLQVRTPAFKNWFGDWENNPENASKVVDENGEPAITYRGQMYDKEKKLKRKTGLWLSDNPYVASEFSGIEDFEFDPENSAAKGMAPQVSVNYANAKNPLIVDAELNYWAEIPFEGDTVDTNELALIAKQRGHDGLVIKNVYEGGEVGGSDQSTTYVVFSNKQLKSAISNRGTFSQTSSNTLYSMGIQEITQQLWNDPTDIRPEIVNKPGLLQKWRADFIDFFAEMEKKSKDIYDTYSLLRSKKAARIEQARQEYFLPLRKLIAESPWTAQEVGDMAAARHIKVDKVNIELAKSASYGYTKELLKALSTTKRKELMQARVHVKAGKMPDGGVYLDANENPAQMSARTKQQLMFNLMNKYSQYEITGADGIQVLREEWELFKDAAAGFSDGGVGSTKVRTVGDVLKLAGKDRAKFDQIMTLFDAANRHTLELLEDGELITAAEHARLLLDKSAYAPLRRESYRVDEEIARLFQRAGQGGSKQIATRAGTENLSEPTLVLQNALAAIEAAAAAAERNLANKELYKVIVKDRAGWKPWFTIVEKDKYVTHDEDGFLQEKNATASNRADITLINDGKKLVIRPNMHNERAVGFVRAVNNLDAQVINGPMKVLNWLNQIVRWVNVTASPIFLMTNAFKDPFTAFYNIKATEAEKYTKEIFNPKTYKDSFRALKKVFMDGNRDPTDPDVQWVEKWELAGGRTSFIETLRDMDETWKSFDKQVSRRKGTILGINAPGFKSLMQAKDKWIDGLENFNILFENVMRFSTFKVLMENNAVSEAQAARISQDLTTNFTRRGYKTQALGTWWLFFNATVQGNYQVLRNLMSSKKVQAAVGGTVVMALLLDLLGRAVDDDWDKVSEWDKERFIVLPIKVAGDFVRIPAPWVYNVVWRTGGLLGEMLSGVKEPQDALLDIAAMATTTFNPLGKPGSLAQAISPTGFDPFMQIIENKNFAGNPIGPEGFPGASKKANSELMWSSTPPRYQSFARFVNEATGGSAVESGAIDLKPGDYQILVNFLTGSLGRFMSDATFGVKEGLDKDFEGMRDIPVVKEFFSDPYDPLKSQKYHTNIAGIYGAHKLEQLYVKGPDRDLIKLQEVRENRGKELRMYSQAQDVERQIKSLRVRLRAAQNRGDTAREKELRDRIGKIQERFNNVYQQRMG